MPQPCPPPPPPPLHAGRAGRWGRRPSPCGSPFSQACRLLPLPHHRPPLSSGCPEIQSLESMALGWLVVHRHSTWPVPLSGPQFAHLENEAPPQSPSSSGCEASRPSRFSSAATGGHRFAPHLRLCRPPFPFRFVFVVATNGFGSGTEFQFLTGPLAPSVPEAASLPGP